MIGCITAGLVSPFDAPLKPSTVDYLVVAGGGAVYFDIPNQTPTWAGGGGAGGFRTATSFSLPSSFTVTIGAGAPRGTTDASLKGSNSVFASITSAGGGGAADSNGDPGNAGGSGGGGAGSPIASGGSGNQGGYSPVEGYAGGSGGSTYGGGGGGSSSVGSTGSANGAAGGTGTANSYSGSSVTYATGGSGGSSPTGDGAANTGDGASARGNGGSGVVIIRYSDTNADLTSIGGGLSYTKTVSGGYKIYRFTAGTGTVTV